MVRRVVARAEKGVSGWCVSISRLNNAAVAAKKNVMSRYRLRSLTQLTEKKAREYAKEINSEYIQRLT